MAHGTGGSVAGLDHVRDRLQRWRRTPGRGRGIPEEIWTAAVGFARQHSVSYIARSLGLSFDRLKSRLAAEAEDVESVSSSPGFIERVPVGEVVLTPNRPRRAGPSIALRERPNLQADVANPAQRRAFGNRIPLLTRAPTGRPFSRSPRHTRRSAQPSPSRIAQ